MATKSSNRPGVRPYLACDGRRHGRGVRVWSNGNRYEGEWEGDKMVGFGVFEGEVSDVHQRYEGAFANGHREGRGICHYGNTALKPFVCGIGNRHDGRAMCKYEGEWWLDVYHGKGVYTCADGRVYNGQVKQA